MTRRDELGGEVGPVDREVDRRLLDVLQRQAMAVSPRNGGSPASM